MRAELQKTNIEVDHELINDFTRYPWRSWFKSYSFYNPVLATAEEAVFQQSNWSPLSSDFNFWVKVDFL